jgi:tetratricopeptide (TPR) repeat protein/predicted Ser/Thr protein kinase
MTDEIRLLFHELADLSQIERERIFAERATAAYVRVEVESLLEYDDPDRQSLTMVVSRAARQAESAGEVEAIGMCGPYRLLQKLGSGGMGTVFLAERSDGEVQQNVAIKLLRADAGSSWHERFLRERQLLADLNHPSLTCLLDAGHTSEGRPYLAMEYVDGIPIDVFGEHKSLREKLGLFLGVCEAVAHAHRHLIVHRDLKPSNILVTAAGEPKLLDFGIAKVLDDTANVTHPDERLMTPNYASPEQLRGANQTTLTDVYSLGAVLYKLVTGRSPHESEEGVSQALEFATGRREISAPSQLNAHLPTDIDFILRKALRHEPNERYASVESLANDIRAFLGSRPIEARSGDTWYRTRRYVRRHWATVTAAALALVSLAVGLGVAERQRAIAQRRFDDVRQVANRLFEIDAQARQVSGTTKVRELIVDTSLAYLQRLAADVRGDPELSLELGNAYMRVARVQGVPTASNLGQMDKAEENLRVAEGFIQSVLGVQPFNRTALLRMAQIDHDRMLVARLNGGHDAALKFAHESENWIEKFHADKRDLPEKSSILTVYMNVADEYYNDDQPTDALRLSGRGTEVARAFDNRPYIGMFKWVAAETYQQVGDLDHASEQIRESVTMLQPGADVHDSGRILNWTLVLIWEGRILGEENGVSLGRTQEAIESFNQAFQILDPLVHQDARDQSSRGKLQMAGMGLADLLRHTDPARALEIYDHTLQHLMEIPDNSSFLRSRVKLLAHSSYALSRLNRSAEARRRLSAAFALLKELKLYPAKDLKLGSLADDTLRALADYEMKSENWTRAGEIYRILLQQIAGSDFAEGNLISSLQVSNLYAAAALFNRRAGRAADAEGLITCRMDLWRKWAIKLPNNPFVRSQLAKGELDRHQLNPPKS